MTARAFAASALVTLAAVLLLRAIYDLSWESALVLAPVGVIGGGMILGLLVLWSKIVAQSLRERRR